MPDEKDIWRKNWHEELSQYSSPQNNDYNHQAILSDNDWKRIVSLGFDSKQALSKLISEDEKVILLRSRNATSHPEDSSEGS